MKKAYAGPPRAIGYVRVSTDEQHASGAGLQAQEATIRAAAAHRGWDLLRIVGADSGASSMTLDRPELVTAMTQLDRHEADVLVVAKLDRLSRSVMQGSTVLDRARRKGWALVALDLGLDTTTSVGEMVASVILSTAQYERRVIGERTKAALAARKAAGVRLGAPQVLTDDVVGRIVSERATGLSLAAIADGLNADKVPTARGGVKWYPVTISAVVKSQAGVRLRAGLVA